MYAADTRTTAAIRRHRNEQLRTRRSRQERRVGPLRAAVTSRAGRLQAAAPGERAAANPTGQPAW